MAEFDIRKALTDIFNIVSTHGKRVDDPIIRGSEEYELDGIIAHKDPVNSSLDQDDSLNIFGVDTPEGSIVHNPGGCIQGDLTDKQIKQTLQNLQLRFH